MGTPPTMTGRIYRFAAAPVRARRLSAQRQLRARMSRATPARNRVHAQLQRRYRARLLRRFLSTSVKQGDLVFDIGANVGEWSAVLRSLRARVVAVEPQSECAAAVRGRFAGDSGLSVVESAVGDSPGVGNLYLASSSSEHASMSEEWRRAIIQHRGMPEDGWPESVEVPVTTVDGLIGRFGAPTFCKIDVEGHEAEVLAGLSEPLRALAFEFHHELLSAVERCVKRLKRISAYRYRIYVDEWPDPVGDEIDAAEVMARVAELPAGSWGMVLARRAT